MSEKNIGKIDTTILAVMRNPQFLLELSNSLSSNVTNGVSSDTTASTGILQPLTLAPAALLPPSQCLGTSVIPRPNFLFDLSNRLSTITAPNGMPLNTTPQTGILRRPILPPAAPPPPSKYLSTSLFGKRGPSSSFHRLQLGDKKNQKRS